MATYQLVGYSQTQELGRVRIYILADAPVTAHSWVYITPMSAPFDGMGQPLQLRPASSTLAARVRAHLLSRAPPAYVAAAPFEPLGRS